MTTYDAYASYNRMAGMPYPYGLGGASQLGAGASAGGYSGMSLAGSYSSSAGIDMMKVRFDPMNTASADDIRAADLTDNVVRLGDLLTVPVPDLDLDFDRNVPGQNPVHAVVVLWIDRDDRDR